MRVYFVLEKNAVSTLFTVLIARSSHCGIPRSHLGGKIRGRAPCARKELIASRCIAIQYPSSSFPTLYAYADAPDPNGRNPTRQRGVGCAALASRTATPKQRPRARLALCGFITDNILSTEGGFSHPTVEQGELGAPALSETVEQRELDEPALPEAHPLPANLSIPPRAWSPEES